jgi:CBS domain-containing protein
MVKVEQLLTAKGREIWSISPDDSVFAALEMMAEKNVGGLLVIENAELVGIITERDYARKVILQGKASKEISVRDIMTQDVIYVNSDQLIEDCMALMTEKRIRHLPVYDGEDLVGVISIGDVVKALISEHEFVIEQLVSYITGP